MLSRRPQASTVSLQNKPQVALQDPATKELDFSDLSGNVLVEASVTHFRSIFFFNTLSRFEFDLVRKVLGFPNNGHRFKKKAKTLQYKIKDEPGYC